MLADRQLVDIREFATIAVFPKARSVGESGWLQSRLFNRAGRERLCVFG